MPITAQHGLLARLLDYVVEQSKEIDPRVYVLTGASDFRRFPKDLAGLPGVESPSKSIATAPRRKPRLGRLVLQETP